MNSSNIPREFLAQLTQNPRTIRYLEDLGTDVISTLPELIESAQLSADEAGSMANSAMSIAINAFDAALNNIENTVNSVSADLAELKKNIPDDNAAFIQPLIADIAEIKKAGSMKPKRIINASITIGAGNSSDFYTIIPPCVLASTIITNNGQSAPAGTPVDSASIALELTNASTITARRGGTSNNVTVYFQMVEY